MGNSNAKQRPLRPIQERKAITMNYYHLSFPERMVFRLFDYIIRQ